MKLVVNARHDGDGLMRICSTLRRRGFAIEELRFARTAAPGISRITVELCVDEERSHLVKPALLKVVDVLDVEEEK